MSSRSHPSCINSGNPYHQCSEYCFAKIAERRAVPGEALHEEQGGAELPVSFGRARPLKRPRDDAEKTAEPVRSNVVETVSQTPDTRKEDREEEAVPQPDSTAFHNMTPAQQKLFELRLRLNQARKANQFAVTAEKKKEETPEESRGVSKKKWFEEKQKRIEKELEADGFDLKKAFMLDSQEDAEKKYKKWDKKPAAFGWDVFNQRSLYNAYKKRCKDIPYSMEDYNKAKESDPDFYRDGASLVYAQKSDVPVENVDKMVAELENRGKARKEFSRRRRYHEEKDIDSINDRNEHFNRKIERAFGKYTIEIKNNLERGTALPD